MVLKPSVNFNLREIPAISCLQDSALMLVMFFSLFTSAYKHFSYLDISEYCFSPLSLTGHLLHIHKWKCSEYLFFTLFRPLFQVRLDVGRSGKDSRPRLAQVLCSFKLAVAPVALDPRSVLTCATEVKWYLNSCVLALLHLCSKPPSEPSPLQVELHGPTNPLEQPPGNMSNFTCRPKGS